MVAHIRQNLIRALPLYGAVTGGVLMTVIVALLPTETLESLVWTTGVAALVPAASPPLGMTARVLLALGSGVLVGALLWSSLFLLFGPGGMLAKRTPREDGMPVIRRADAHPDAPPRKPMSAADLGTPMMEVGVGGSGGARDERTIPVDLDLPLAAFDPKAILPVPMEPVRPVPPLAQPMQPTMVAPVIEVAPTAEPETFVTAPAPQPVEPPIMMESAVAAPEPMPEVSAPTPIARPPRAPAEPTTPPTIETLLQRLEQGALRRGRMGSH
ncbi:hypothetical protein IFR23_01460 [Sphingomonas sp. CFBP 13603]|uniref:hypothetical protein n=1 Tax=Sphingomonas sp. CFBP 13603 TaxID=2774040 RepID=UPI001866058B|nr:hypothetical protein [Sphingomonas sp. CFBP 13603]MBE2990677.1 hypothetical protein [Sphingomonas sp. CFBP 13603]